MSQFKKPTSVEQCRSVPKFSMDESELGELGFQKKEEFPRPEGRPDPHASHAADAQGTALSVIMEATREYNRYGRFRSRILFNALQEHLNTVFIQNWTGDCILDSSKQDVIYD